MTKISATVITLNEEENIRGCLESLSWCDEIIIVDSYSDDDTVEIAEEYSDEIFQLEEKGFSEPYRKFAAEKASGDWIVQIDADERISPGLKEKLEEISETETDVVKAPRKNFRFGKWIRDGDRWPDFTTCMYRPEKVSFSDDIHDFLSFGEGSDIEILEAKEELSIIHYSYLGISDHVERANRYTDINLEQGEKNYSSVLKTIYIPFYSFGRNFVYKRGFKDGLEGLMVALMDSLAKFLYNLKVLEHSKFGGQKVYSKTYEEIDKKMGFKER
jgi:glycosyltransferase involved in cell wall biosynthesis